nr:PREDICTED: UDP-GlcNAc:betaGal beta-1,3-N-acetylglucosaminyltransferase 3 [Equus przewalskii]
MSCSPDLGFRAQGELARFGASPVATDSSHALSFPKAAATPDGAEESKEEAAVIPARYSGCGGTKKTPWSVSAPGQSSGNPDKPAWPRDSAQEGEVPLWRPGRPQTSTVTPRGPEEPPGVPSPPQPGDQDEAADRGGPGRGPGRLRPPGALESARASFFNLTLKQVLFLQWQQTRCANASFMLNGDDDVFAHTDNMVSYLQDHSPDRHLFVGQLIRNVGPIRVPWSKYYVPKIVTPDDHYPPYCGGGGFLLSRFTAAALHRASQGLELFPIDDVFLGMCLRREGLEPASHSGIRTSGVGAPSASMSSFDPCFYRELLLVHRFLPYEMLLMWEALSQPNLTCGKRTQVF